MERDIEETTVRAFAPPERGKRYVALLRTQTRRTKFIGLLAHDFDFSGSSAIRPLEKREESADQVYELLRQRGASEDCYVMSEWDKIDGRRMDLLDALEWAFAGGGLGTLISCIPGELAYYAGEEPHRRFILEQTSTTVR